MTDKKVFADVASSAFERIDLRAQTARMTVVNEDAFERLRTEQKKLDVLASMHLLNGEQRACAIFDWFFQSGNIPGISESPARKVVKELTFKRGMRVDRAIFHENGQLTLVEIKDACSPREVVGGIGQVLMYAALAEREYSNTPIVPCLAVLGDRDEDVARACSRGGVEYIPLGGVEFLRTLSELAYVVSGYGK